MQNTESVAGYDARTLIYLLLGAALLVHAIGLFSVVFGAHQTHFGNYLFLVIEMPNARAVFLEKVIVSVFLLFTVAAVLRPRWYMFLPVFAYVFFEAYAGYYQGGYRFSEYTLATYALRYAVPLALFVSVLPVTHTFTNERRLWATSWILRIGLAVVFFIHGLECLKAYPPFIDLLIGSFWNVFGLRIMEASAVQILQIIGTVDIAIALALLYKPWSYILFWMAFWGTLTAFSRITALGWGAYFEVLLRASHMIAPIAVWLIVSKLSSDEKKYQNESAEFQK